MTSEELNIHIQNCIYAQRIITSMNRSVKYPYNCSHFYKYYKYIGNVSGTEYALPGKNLFEEKQHLVFCPSDFHQEFLTRTFRSLIQSSKILDPSSSSVISRRRKVSRFRCPYWTDMSPTVENSKTQKLPHFNV